MIDKFLFLEQLNLLITNSFVTFLYEIEKATNIMYYPLNNLFYYNKKINLILNNIYHL